MKSMYALTKERADINGLQLIEESAVFSERELLFGRTIRFLMKQSSRTTQQRFGTLCYLIVHEYHPFSISD